MPDDTSLTRRVLVPDRYSPISAASTSRVRRAYRGNSRLRHSSVPPSGVNSRPRGTVMVLVPSAVVSVRSRGLCR